MILADTSVWVDHLRQGDADLARALASMGFWRPSNAQIGRRSVQALVARPQPGIGGQQRGGQQMHVDPAQATAGKLVLLDRVQHFVVLGLRRRRQGSQQVEHVTAVLQMAKRDFADDERVYRDGALLQRPRHARQGSHDFDYEVLGETNGMMLVSVTGTAVKMA